MCAGGGGGGGGSVPECLSLDNLLYIALIFSIGVQTPSLHVDPCMLYRFKENHVPVNVLEI